MKRFVIPLFSVFVVFFLVLFFSNQFKVKPKKISIIFHALVQEDNTFQLFYSFSDEDGFSEENSIRKQVTGKPKFQNIKFNLPVGASIKRLRIDIGQIKNQQPITIAFFKLTTLRESYKYDFLSSFTPNNFITIEGGKCVTKMIDNVFDPFLISNIGMEEKLERQYAPVLPFKKSLVYGVALIFGLASFIFFFLHPIPIGRVASYSYIFAFFMLLSTPSLVVFFDFNSPPNTNEKRKLAKRPEVKLSKKFAGKYENYYNDNFGLRTFIIEWTNRLKINIFKTTTKPDLVQFGEDDFLFYTPNRAFLSYSNTNLLPPEKLEKAYQKQLAIKKKLNQRNIIYIYGFWPDKHTIYPEKMPLNMQVQVRGEQSLANQIATYFNEKGFHFFDVSNDLIKAKEKNKLYFKFDTHWNLNGAFEAYQSFCKQTYSEIGITPLKRNDFDITYEKTQYGDLIRQLGLDSISIFSEQTPAYVLKDKSKGFYIAKKSQPPKKIITINETCGNKKVVLVFRDSFSSFFMQFFSQHFYKVIYIWDYPIDMKLVGEKKPDIVISAPLERFLPVTFE